MLRLLGYTDRLNTGPGDTVRFMVSCDQPHYESNLVRLIHGDTNPAGPGFKQVVVPSPIDGRRPGTHRHIRSGSYAEIQLGKGAGPAASFTFSVFVQPTNPGLGEQVIAGQGDPYASSGWALALSGGGLLELVVGQGTDAGASRAKKPNGPVRRTMERPLRRWQWYFVAVAVDRSLGSATIVHRAVPPWPGEGSMASLVAEVPGTAAGPAMPLVLAGARGDDGRTSRHLDGKLDRPRLLGRALELTELVALADAPDNLKPFMPGVVGAWDFSQDFASDRVSDISGNDQHGGLVNMPTRAVTGYNFSGRETSFRLAPAEYGAVHFHRDDLEDAGWPADFELTIPDDLPTGVYAAWLRAGDDEDYLPFIVRPRRGTSGSRIAVLMSTMTYVTYQNFTDLGPGAWREGGYVGEALHQPLADSTIFRDIYQYIDDNALYGLYDSHVDGSGVCYGSTLKPILNMRPKFRYRSMNCPARFPADLYLVDWLDHKGITVDFLTDHDLHAEGADLLKPYSVVLSSSHHEYWTTAMLDALESYLWGGGRFMYLGGNSLYGVLSVAPDKPHKIELRRWAAGWPFEVPPAERYHSTTGEPGGTWRNRGRAPNGLMGIGTAGAGFDRGSAYERMPDSYDPRVSFIFEGMDGNLIGDQPNLQVQWGAAGYEFDRVELELGSPGTTLRLASSVRFNQSHITMVDDDMWAGRGREGKRTGDPQVPGKPHRFARADMAYLEYPKGGAVFSAGSICWRGALSAYNYENTVSQVTENVLRQFADPNWRRG